MSVACVIGQITQSFLVQYQLAGSPPFLPELVGCLQPHTVGQVLGGVDPMSVYSSIPITTIDIPVTITSALGLPSQFDTVISITSDALDVAAFFGAPLNKGATLAYAILNDINNAYGPLVRTTYTGVQSFTLGAMSAGVTQMLSGTINIPPFAPIRPDDQFNFRIVNTEFWGTFDDPSGNLTDITNVNVFAGVSSGVPEASTWVMLLVGLLGFGLVRANADA